MKKKIRVGIIFGGRSAEHEVSIQSAKNVIEAIDKDKYEPVLIGISKKGEWYLGEPSKFLLESPSKFDEQIEPNNNLALVPGKKQGSLIQLSRDQTKEPIDVIFPILHGPYGEDGTIQGLLKIADIPFVGAGVIGSAAGMDKDVMKRLLRDAEVPIAKFITVHKHSAKRLKFEEIKYQTGIPFFVKPANLGSSVGIGKVKDENQFEHILIDAFRYDNKILIEEYIEGREIECSVLGNENPIASIPGEVIPQHEFYSYEAKYTDSEGAILEIPAKISTEITEEIQNLAVKTFTTICCEGMGRVDFFLKEDGEVIVNEINTIPGFTNISMYPKLWEASGISYTELINRLIQLAIERFERDRALKASYF